MSIPKIMHFIWVGGVIPTDRLEEIKRWRNQYPDFKIVLWTDPEATGRDFGKEAVEDQFRKIQEAGIKDIEIKKISDLLEGNTASSEIIRYEIDRLHPNYGAASDLIRYEALHKYGGVYIDSDVEPPQDTAASLYRNASFWEQADRSYIYRSGEMNDVIFSPKGASGMEILKHYVQENYHLLSKESAKKQVSSISTDGMLRLDFRQTEYADLHVQAYTYSSYSYTKDSTLRRTGPFALKKIFYDKNKNDDNKQIDDITNPTGKVGKFRGLMNLVQGKKEITPSKESQIRVPLERSAQSWLNLNIKPVKDPNIAIKLIFESIDFEINHFGILRLDDHLSDLDDIFQFHDAKEKNEYQACLIKHLCGLDKKKLPPELIVEYPFMHETLLNELLSTVEWLKSQTHFFEAISADTFEGLTSVLKRLKLDVRGTSDIIADCKSQSKGRVQEWSATK